MQSRWNDEVAQTFIHDPLQLRVYTSQLLGGDPALVLHGGGNTSVKITETNLFGEREEILYVKGSGWDLATIEAPGFAPVRLNVLKQMAELDALGDAEMVGIQRSAMTNPYAPNPSVEAILHGIIPFQYVDHTHADAVVIMTNTDDGEARIRELYGPNMLIVPYVMPGFILAKTVYEMTRGIDWAQLDGMVLLNHGVFTFDNDARKSYERMIEIVSQAEAYLERNATVTPTSSTRSPEDLLALAKLRQLVSETKGTSVIVGWDSSDESVRFSNHPDVADIGTRGLLTPDHVIRTKRVPLVLPEPSTGSSLTGSSLTGSSLTDTMEAYIGEYGAYFDRHTDGVLTQLEPAPRWAIWPRHGTIAFGRTTKEVHIINDIKRHTMRAIQIGEALSGWRPLAEKEIFEVEYWELEQAKLKKGGSSPALQGKIALVTGAASGIGLACVEALQAAGAVVVALDINPAVAEQFAQPEILGLVCDLTDREQIDKAIAATVRQFGGLDIIVSNAGMFPVSAPIEEMPADAWEKSMSVNLSSHQYLLQAAIPYLKLGNEPAIVMIASKNVPAPGPSASAYSVAKAGVTQLARIAALELASSGVRVNILHPNAVFDTALWTPALLEKRAESYGITVDEYKRNNLLKVEIRSADVAALACAMAGPLFAKTTGAQVPIDGGNERVI